MLHYSYHSGSSPEHDTIQVYTNDRLIKHICGYWHGPHYDPENPWVMLFPSANTYLYFKDEETLKTFLELHWEEYHRE